MPEQDGPNGAPSTGFAHLRGHDLRKVIAHESIDHRLEVFAHGSDAVVYQLYETKAGKANFTLWIVFSSGRTAGPIAVGATADGRMHLVAYDSGPTGVRGGNRVLIQVWPEAAHAFTNLGTPLAGYALEHTRS